MQKLVLFQKMEDFTNYLFPILDRFPKHEKFALVSQIKNLCYDILTTIIRANKSRNKLPGWYDADVQLELLRWFLRHSRERTYLCPRSYETAAKSVGEIGRVLGGLVGRGAVCERAATGTTA